MKLTAMLYSAAFAAIAIISACESDVTDVVLPAFSPKPVITAFLSPSDTISRFYISSSGRLYGDLTDAGNLGDISASVSNGDHEVQLDIEDNIYILDHRKMKIEYGKTYSIKVISSKGAIAEATCTVPEKRLFEIKLDTVRTPENINYIPLIAIVSFEDEPGEDNYYRIGITTRAYFSSYEGMVRGYQSPEKKFISDEKTSEGRITVGIIGHLNYLTEFSDSAFIAVKLFHTEKSYYLYHKALDNYEDGDSPFTEPTPVYSNITGGLGVFTSYTVDSAVFRLK